MGAFSMPRCFLTNMGTPFLFQNWSSYMINIQWTKFERKSIASFISEELPQAHYFVNDSVGLWKTCGSSYTRSHRNIKKKYLAENPTLHVKTVELPSHVLGWKVNNVPRNYFPSLKIRKNVKDNNNFFCEASQLTQASEQTSCGYFRC